MWTDGPETRQTAFIQRLRVRLPPSCLICCCCCSPASSHRLPYPAQPILISHFELLWPARPRGGLIRPQLVISTGWVFFSLSRHVSEESFQTYWVFLSFVQSLLWKRIFIESAEPAVLVLEQWFPTVFAWCAPDIEKAEAPIIHPAVHVGTKIICSKWGSAINPFWNWIFQHRRY